MVSKKLIFCTFLGGLIQHAYSQQILSPGQSLTVKEPSETDGLYVGDSLICNDKTCYPKVFNAAEEWNVVKPLQRLPGGLDIRVNIDTGLKEARLLPAGVKPSKQQENEGKKKNELAVKEEQEEKEDHTSTSDSSTTSTTSLKDEYTGTITSTEVSTTAHELEDATFIDEDDENDRPEKPEEAVKLETGDDQREEEQTEDAKDSGDHTTTKETKSESTDTPDSKEGKKAGKDKASETVLEKEDELAIPNDSKVETKDATDEYEFTNQFKVIRDIYYKKGRLSADDLELIASKLDDLMEFTHDFKHGLKIITHEFELLSSISLSEALPISLREMSTRAIASCIRNNPPVLDFIVLSHKEFISDIFIWLASFQNKSIEVLNLHKTLIKRYLSILDEVLTRIPNYSITVSDFDSLTLIYESLADQQIKIKVLELISRFFSKNLTSLDVTRSNGNDDDASIKKRSEEVLLELQKWTNELTKAIQDKNNDEMHIRKFFNGLHSIKVHYKDQITVDSSFLNWLAKETEVRKSNLGNGEVERDQDQDSFDALLVSSRHITFGNPLAHNLKHDEL